MGTVEQILESKFPNLKQSPYDVTSPQTPEYNCIAWAAGDSERFWWPDPFNSGYWPRGVPRQVTITSFIAAFGTVGFQTCENAVFENNFEKIALYVDSQGIPTHAARQLENGMWTSKLGQSFDIAHALDGVSGNQYGTIAIFMKRLLD